MPGEAVTLLSPAPAILAAFCKRYAETLRPGPFVDRWQGQCLAAAFRAAADRMEFVQDHLKLLAIADELEADR
jgi:hypothetical protein